jgi:hypothetical protein
LLRFQASSESAVGLECMTINFEGSFSVEFRHALMLKEVGIMAEFSLERVLVEGCDVLVTSKIIK